MGEEVLQYVCEGRRVGRVRVTDRVLAGCRHDNRVIQVQETRPGWVADSESVCKGPTCCLNTPHKHSHTLMHAHIHKHPHAASVLNVDLVGLTELAGTTPLFGSIICLLRAGQCVPVCACVLALSV